MKISIDVVVAHCTMTLDELLNLQKSQIKPCESFVQSKAILKSGGEIIAVGTLVKVDDQYCVSIEDIS
ncbi:FliM/FliN family flagellar motor switch protein, partial [Vibrio cholerae]|nr:FliM/FliN family flagellar motor switch protein [Vibrio cholerae]